MLKNITRFFDQRRQILSLEYENRMLRMQQDYLQRQLQQKKVFDHSAVPVAGFDTLECEPTDAKERAGYIQEVSNFFDGIFRDKLKVSIAEIRNELAHLSGRPAAEIQLTREQYDFFMRGMEAMAWKMHDWCITLQGERKQALQEEANNE